MRKLKHFKHAHIHIFKMTYGVAFFMKWWQSILLTKIMQKSNLCAVDANWPTVKKIYSNTYAMVHLVCII